MAGVIDTAYGESIRQYEAYEVKIRTADDLIREVNEYMDCDEFGKQLVDHFPMEDGMPAFSDVRDFMQNWSDRDYDFDAVDFMCMLMELAYPFVLSAEEHRMADEAEMEAPGKPYKECTIEELKADFILLGETPNLITVKKREMIVKEVRRRGLNHHEAFAG